VATTAEPAAKKGRERLKRVAASSEGGHRGSYPLLDIVKAKVVPMLKVLVFPALNKLRPRRGM
jgi:hypothetical protein